MKIEVCKEKVFSFILRNKLHHSLIFCIFPK